jgi:hypothetical protein
MEIHRPTACTIVHYLQQNKTIKKYHGQKQHFSQSDSVELTSWVAGGLGWHPYTMTRWGWLVLRTVGGISV